MDHENIIYFDIYLLIQIHKLFIGLDSISIPMQRRICQTNWKRES